MENRSIAGLDLIRFGAAAMVVWFHLAYFQWLSTKEAWFLGLAPIASFGWVGVEIFFVLSGFVIAYSAEGKTAMTFARSRFLRLYPAVWICASISAGILAASQAEIAGAYMRSMILWPIGPWVDGVYWTLGIEMVFYGLVFSLLTFRAYNLFGILIGGIGIVSSAFWAYWLFDHASGGDALGWTMGHRYFELSLIHYGCFFALGSAIWLLLFKNRTWGRWAIAGLSFSAGGICIYAIAQIKEASGQGHSPLAPIIVYALAVVLIVMSITHQITINWIEGRISRLLGLTTYPLYLLHHVVGAWLITALISREISPNWALATSILIVLSVSILVLRAERLARGFVAKIWDKVLT